MHQFDCLILSGGANRGIAFGGALQVLERHGITKNMKYFVGSSVGALTAGLLSVHYTADEIVETIFKYNLKDLKPEWSYREQLSNLIFRYGRYTTEQMESIVNELLQKHYELPEITFQQLYDFVGTTLMVTTCCINSGHTEYLSRLTVPDMPVYRAICMSMCIPVEFEPYSMEDMLYCDGGMFGHNLPREHPPEIRTCNCLAICIDKKYDLRVIKSGLDLAAALWNGFQTALDPPPVFKDCIPLVCDVGLLDDIVSKKDKKKYIVHAREIHFFVIAIIYFFVGNLSF